MKLMERPLDHPPKQSTANATNQYELITKLLSFLFLKTAFSAAEQAW